MVMVVKASGEEEAFSEAKLRTSIKRAGIPADLEEEVIAHVKSSLHDKITSSEIYHHILEFLNSSSTPHHQARYSLKQAIMDLGPTGYPFEDYIAHVLNHEGYQTTVRNMIQGKCISHEIDVIATKGEQNIMVEAKFHNSTGIKTDVHVSLYTKARFEDTKEKNRFTKPMLVTNTKLTGEAVTYAQCVGMEVLGWSYPENESLRDLVEKHALFPLTVLTSLPNTFKQQLLQQGIVMCKDLCLNPQTIMSLDLPDEKKQRIKEEAAFLCKEKIVHQD